MNKPNQQEGKECGNALCTRQDYPHAHDATTTSPEESEKPRFPRPAMDWKQVEIREFARFCNENGGVKEGVVQVNIDTIAEYIFSRVAQHEKKIREEIAREIEAHAEFHEMEVIVIKRAAQIARGSTR